MQTAGQSVTFVVSRTTIVAAAIPLLTFTAALGVSFTRLAKASFSAGWPPASIVVLVLFGAFMSFLVYLDYRVVVTFRRPARLTVTDDGICEYRSGTVQSDRWENLSNPQRTFVNLGGGNSISYIEMARPTGQTLRIRDDIYPESGPQLLAVIESAMARQTMVQPVPSGQASGYILVTFSAVLTISGLVFLWNK